MIVLFDTSTLIFLLKPEALAPIDAGTGEPIQSCKERITYLLSELQKAKATIVIPAPVIAELLVLAGAAAPKWLDILTRSRHFRPAPFDVVASVECAEMAKQRLGIRASNAVKHKAKFDEQIVAIARVERATMIYSDDADIKSLAGDGIQVLGMQDIDLPPTDAQGSFNLETAPPLPTPLLEEE